MWFTLMGGDCFKFITGVSFFGIVTSKVNFFVKIDATIRAGFRQ